MNCQLVVYLEIHSKQQVFVGHYFKAEPTVIQSSPLLIYIKQSVITSSAPACVLATDEQLRQLVLNCTRQDNFGVMHIDPTFNLGEFFVTPIVFPLVNYMHGKSKGGCPTFIGPVLLHH